MHKRAGNIILTFLYELVQTLPLEQIKIVFGFVLFILVKVFMFNHENAPIVVSFSLSSPCSYINSPTAINRSLGFINKFNFFFIKLWYF